MYESTLQKSSICSFLISFSGPRLNIIPPNWQSNILLDSDLISFDREEGTCLLLDQLQKTSKTLEHNCALATSTLNQ